MSTLEIRDLHVSVEESPGVQRQILRGVERVAREGEAGGAGLKPTLRGDDK